jgi:hypothetical protein
MIGLAQIIRRKMAYMRSLFRAALSIRWPDAALVADANFYPPQPNPLIYQSVGRMRRILGGDKV